MRHRDRNILPTNVPAKQVFLNDEKEAYQRLRLNILLNLLFWKICWITCNIQNIDLLLKLYKYA